MVGEDADVFDARRERPGTAVSTGLTDYGDGGPPALGGAKLRAPLRGIDDLKNWLPIMAFSAKKKNRQCRFLI